jgi:hypothetical protein
MLASIEIKTVTIPFKTLNPKDLKSSGEVEGHEFSKNATPHLGHVRRASFDYKTSKKNLD